MTTSSPAPPSDDTAAGTTAKPQASGMAELVVPAILVAIAVFLIIGTANMVQPPSVQRPGPTFFPGIIIALLLVMAALSTVQTLRTVRARRAGLLQDEQEAHLDADGDPIEEIPPDPPPCREPWPVGAVTDWRAVLTVLGSLVAFMVLLRPVGWIVAAAVLFWGVAYALGSRRPLFDVSVALVMSSVIQLTFGYLLGLNLPAGFLAGVM
jgi:putative tricarboxylic transport membrane protein